MIDLEFALAGDYQGWTPLHYASHLGDHKLVELLIRKYESKSVNSQEPGNNYTPLMLACENLHKNVIERLLLAGANCNLQNKRGETSLHILARVNKKGCAELIKLLMPFSKESLLVKDERGRIPSEKALDSSIKELLKTSDAS